VRVVFMGTPSGAVPALRAVHDAFGVRAVYTRPDAAKGRGLRVEPSPVKKVASDLGIRIEQPASLKTETSRIAALEPDVILVVAYGAILRPDVLSIPRLGCVNVHFSLLPRWRGAAPVERAILAGDPATGVTTILMDEGLDTGPILLEQRDEIRPDDTTGTLRRRLAQLGSELAVRTIELLERGEIVPRPQSDDGATYAAKIGASDAKVDPFGAVEVAERVVRAMNPSPGAYVTFRGKRLKIWQASVFGNGPALPNGLHLVEVQPEGKRRMSGEEFARGHRPAAEDFA
jgi:methionyl-tRNA formyltransferase